MTVRDLHKLPFVTKDELRRDPASFCPGGSPAKGASAWHTSGSTGTPLAVYISSNDFRRALALRDARYESFAGVTFRMPRGTFGGRHVTAKADSTGPFHRYNAAERQVYFSSYHLGPTTVGAYVAALEQHRPAWLTGYASVIHDLARLSLEQGIPCPPIRAVVTSSEPVTARARSDVARAFGCRVTDEYGLAEQVCFALECEEGSLHVSPDAGVLEIVDEEGAPCESERVGEVVGTGFLHEAQPLIRYRTGDFAAWSSKPCRCGRAMPVLASIEGRVGDVVIGEGGRRVGRLTSTLNELPGVAAAQFIQKELGALTVRILQDGPLEPWVEEELRRRLRARLGTQMRIEIEQATSLERTAAGKVRSVIADVTRDG